MSLSVTGGPNETHTCEGRDVLILILLEDIPDNKIIFLFFCARPRRDNVGKNLFWQCLREELQRPVQVNRRFVV